MSNQFLKFLLNLALWISNFLRFIIYKRLIALVMILDEFKNQRFDIIPVNWFFLWNRDKVLSIEYVINSLYLEKAACKGRYFICLLRTTDINRLSSTHDNLGGGHELEKVRIGCLFGLYKEREEKFSCQQHLL